MGGGAVRRVLLLGTTLLMLVTGCAPAGADHRSAVPPPTLTSSGADPGDQALIYAAVLRRYLSTPQDNSNLGFATVFVLDHTDVAAADPMRTAASTTTAPISAADQRGIAAALRDVAPVRFVASRDQVIVSTDGCAVVRDNGILILLGPPVPAGGTVQVAINGYVACLGATWLTYVVAHHPDGWQVTGTTGVSAVA
jgi:hypothetical protein